MWAREAVYRCKACGAEPVLPGMDLTWSYGHYFGLTVVGEHVVGDLSTGGNAFDMVLAWVREGAEAGTLPADAVDRNLHWRLLEVAIDRSPLGHPYCCYQPICLSCGERALRLNLIDDRPRIPGEVPWATFTAWRSLTVADQEERLRAEADCAYADPWFMSWPG